MQEILDSQKPKHTLSSSSGTLGALRPDHELNLPTSNVTAPEPPSPRQLAHQLSVRSIGRVQSFQLDDLHKEIDKEDTKHLDDLFDCSDEEELSAL